MTPEEYKILRLAEIADVLTEWAESDEKQQSLYKGYSTELYNWHKGRAEAYRLAAGWIKETLQL